MSECPETYPARSDHYQRWETFGHICSLGRGHLGSHRCRCEKGWSAWSWMNEAVDDDALATIAWRYTMVGAVAHAVLTDGSNRALGPSFCGRESADGQWHYGPTFGQRTKCLRCRTRVINRASAVGRRRAAEKAREAEMNGADMIAAERRRQIVEERFTADHDAGHADELARAAATYALPEAVRSNHVSAIGWRGPVPPLRAGATWQERLWPWAGQWWKPTPEDRVRELTKAGALIAAAIDSLIASRPETP